MDPLVTYWLNDPFEHRLEIGDACGGEGIPYRLWMGSVIIFENDDFEGAAPSEQTAPETAAALLKFLTLTREDVDAGFFIDYTSVQLKWRDDYAAELKVYVFYLETLDPNIITVDAA